jgi:hypothetical protein
MNYINNELFLSQKEKVQENLKNWWLNNFKFGNLCYNEKYQKCVVINKWQYNFSCISSYLEGECILGFDEVTPLFNETQLIEYIKDKLSGVTKVVSYIFYRYDNEDKMIRVYVGYFEPFGYNAKSLGKYDSSLSILEIYWRIALELAEKESLLKR